MGWRMLRASPGAPMERIDSRLDLNLFRVLEAI
jgi:hypothetical protein